MQSKNKFMNEMSKKILDKKNNIYNDANSRKSRSKSKDMISNYDLDDVFSLKDDEFSRMGYIDSMKTHEL